MRFARVCALTLATAFVSSGATMAQLAVSANDGKAVLVDGVAQIPAHPRPDTVTIIDLNVFPPKIVGTVVAPASVIGPPQSVAIAPDGSFALVSGAMKIDPSDPSKTIPDNALSVIDLRARPIAVVQTLQAGLGAAGVAINRAGTLAIVANRSEGALSVFSIREKTLTSVGTLALGDAKSGPSGVVFTPDGKAALVTRDGDNRISLLSIEGSKVVYTGRDLFAGLRPYGIEMSPKGDIAIVANIGIGGGDADTLSIVDLKNKPPQVMNTISVGPTPEGIALSHDGKFLAVTVINGSNKPKASPQFHDFGLLKLYAVQGTNLRPVASAHIGHWCQGAAWSRNTQTLLVQCMAENRIEIFRFDGHTLKTAGALKVDGGPAGIRVAQ